MPRTRRRTRYTWLPTLGTAFGEDGDNSSGRSFNLNVPADGTSAVLISALTFDEPLEGDDLALGTPLGTVLGNEYFLKRIVGKLHAELLQVNTLGNDPSRPTACLFGAGFFVARANDTSQGAGSPIGSASLSERQENYSPLAEDTIRKPWIWRRVWTLGNQARWLKPVVITGGQAQATLPAIAIAAGATFPPNTAAYGSVADGPHIDAKTARRIKQDERLWFVVAGRNWPAGDGVVANGGLNVNGYLDFRLLGALRKARQGSAF